ncbi:amino acid adenylation domain-containing protein [Clostridium felsineum]|uniref:amino acid adenylation domain-containing protein n=1 Tax=Clostridium felsineum TaxID=36839 RepID=UPI00214D19B7|nr:amino acid adenylation domain-containing protein [Clostridium felsineum]MCR3759915.1 amino acid adenylation domain-containing protein [Clostridium felsineum]
MLGIKDNKSIECEKFWRKIISEDIEKSSFSHTISNKPIGDYDSLKFIFPQEISREIFKVCNNSSIGIYIYMISAVQYILNIYSNNIDLVIGTEPIKGKSDNDIYGKILMFKSSINVENTFKEFLSQSKEMFVNINKFKLDVQQVQKIAGIEEFDNKTAIIDTIVKFNSISLNKELKDFNVATIFEFDVKQNDIVCSIKYRMDLLDEIEIKGIKNHLINFLKEVTINPNSKLKMINILSDKEKDNLIELGSRKMYNFNKSETIQELFEKQVTLTPNNIAIVFGDKRLTYKYLNEKSNSLARVLRNKGVKSNTIVGIVTERSLEMIIGIFAILKAGGAYLPIDPSYPKERVEYMLGDSSAEILLTMNNILDDVKFTGEIIDLFDNKLFEYDTSNLEKINSFEDLIYIIYTSGTTGKPKGVMVKRGSFNNLVKWYCSEFAISKKDNVLLMSSVGFDLSQKNIYAPLIVGGKLTLANKGVVDYGFVIKVIKNEKITIINCAPSAFNPIVELNKGSNYDGLKSLKYIFLGGEVINIVKLNKWRNSNNCNAEIVNTYGPTECTDIATFYRMNWGEYTSVPIGKPINNVRLYVLNKNRQLLPKGILGELYISGIGISKGYLNKESLTKEKFVDNPFEIGRKMYNTGDLVRWLPDGNLEFLGRRDHQIKIRGFRIEIGEIEKRLIADDKVKEAVVIDRVDELGSKYLCAYLVTNGRLTIKELRMNLSKSLPEYMIPSKFIELKSMPLNNNGKIDRKALVEMKANALTGGIYKEARNETEKKLVNIWMDILKVNKIGIRDSFFELGGNSLSAMFLVAEINKNLNSNISIVDILELKIIENIAKLIDANLNKCEYGPLINIGQKQDYRVSSSQKRMFILQNLNPLYVSYNVQTVKIIKGSLDIDKLENCLKEIIKRHEALRTSFALKENEIVQIINDKVDFNIEIIEGNNEIEYVIKKFVRPFDLTKSPLIRVGIWKYEEEKYVMIMDIHHICSDAITIKILLDELSLLYNEKVLPKVEFQYKDFAYWQNELLKTPMLQSQRDYWYNNLSSYNFKSNIFNRCKFTYRENGKLGRTKFNIGKILENQLENLCHSNDLTLHTVLLTAYSILLYRFSNQEDIIIGTPIAGRQYANLDKIVGVFINTLAIRSFLNSDLKVSELLKQIKNTMHNAFKNQDYPFDNIISDLNIERKGKENLLFNTMFVLNNFNYRELKLLNTEILDYDVNDLGLMVDIDLEVEIVNNELIFTFEYNDMIFRKDLIDKFIYNYIKILRALLNYDIKIGDIKIDEFF